MGSRFFTQLKIKIKILDSYINKKRLMTIVRVILRIKLVGFYFEIFLKTRTDGSV